MQRAPLRGLLLIGLLAASGAPAGASSAPPAGRYAGSLCVTLPGGGPECGPARIEWARSGQARVRVSDLLYALTLHSSQVEVVLKHGAMQIDAFTGSYEWGRSGAHTALHFVDADKRVRYEVRFSGRWRGPR